jgi:hypothetical protein
MTMSSSSEIDRMDINTIVFFLDQRNSINSLIYTPLSPWHSASSGYGCWRWPPNIKVVANVLNKEFRISEKG